jgi:hypothetical protein
MSAIERIDTMFIDHYGSRLGPELLANGGPRRAGFHHPPGFLVLKQRGVGRGISVVVAKRDRDVYDGGMFLCFLPSSRRRGEARAPGERYVLPH